MKNNQILNLNEFLNLVLEKSKEKNKNLLDEINKLMDILIRNYKLDLNNPENILICL